MRRHRLVALLLLFVILPIAGTLARAGDGTDGQKIKKAAGIHGRPAVPTATQRSTQLLDRGDRNHETRANRGGGPSGALPINYPGAGPTATAAGFAAGVGAFGTATGAGAFIGNLFAPGAVPSYPPGILTGGSAPGFDVTGVYAWHSPFLKTGTVSASLAGSTRRILAVAPAAVPATPSAPAAVGPGGFEVVTASTGLPGPTGIVGSAGNLASPVAILPGGFSAVFCGMAVGGPGFIDPGWLGNGIGAVIPTGAPPPTRIGFPPTFFGTTGGSAFPLGVALFTATPQTQIAGCFAAGATTPVELMAFTVE